MPLGGSDGAILARVSRIQLFVHPASE
jgi:hypothetical protein